MSRMWAPGNYVFDPIRGLETLEAAAIESDPMEPTPLDGQKRCAEAEPIIESLHEFAHKLRTLVLKSHRNCDAHM